MKVEQYKVMTHHGTIDMFGIPSTEFYKEMEEVSAWVTDNCKGFVFNNGGPKPGDVEWTFDNNDDAVLFALRWL